MAPTAKNVTIQIDPTSLETLKSGMYKLCFAKMVNNTFNVVWQSYNEYLASNSFQWTPVYQLFGTNTFLENLTVQVSTNECNIGLGEQSTLDAAGNLGPATTGGPSTAITLVNSYGSIHPGINQLSTGIDGTQTTTPIYVAANPVVIGSDLLTPVDQVQVWFEQDITTSTMFSTARSQAVTIDLTSDNTATRAYSTAGGWITPSVAAVGEPATLLTIIVTTTVAISAALLAQKIAAKLTGVYQNIEVSITPPAGTGTQFTIKYQEKTSLTLEQQRFLRTLMASSASRSNLLDITSDALSACNTGFTKLDAQ